MSIIDFVQSHETEIRLSVFVGVLAAMIGLETVFERKKRVEPRLLRWATNLGIVVIYTIVLRLIFPVAAMGTAVYAQAHGYGLLNLVALPIWGHILLSAVVLDLAVYFQHIASHKVGIFWKFHQVHHADRDIDATTGIRFHPVEIVLSMLYKMLVVLALGPHVVGVFIFEVVLNGSAMFNHANIRLPLWLDKIVRTVFVTPDMHRVHHSIYREETDSNYGFNLSIWDRIFRTYIPNPKDGHEKMVIGLPMYQDHKPSNLVWCLALPFHRKTNENLKKEPLS
ncbi:MAG TPA: sterol desaturase family protein [Hellea balneolensis]|uniref:Sterol desaturase family protein n=1 Tax=Hellea balneolensis TaxID=287478 RepID=A0A7C5R010_9PROT|nr:sterol desaturase family protein [Hellea balneolensis]